MSDARELTPERITWVQDNWFRKDFPMDQVRAVFPHIEYLTERVAGLEEALVDATEWTGWKPSADGIGQWAERTCGLCRARTTEDDGVLRHERDCPLATCRDSRQVQEGKR